MSALAHTQTLWLQLTNAGLAIGCVLFMVILAVAVTRDFVTRRQRLASIVRLEAEEFDRSQPGSSLKDGGAPYIDSPARAMS